MRNAFFAALAVLTMSVAVVPAYAHDFHNGSTVAGDSSATQMQRLGGYGDEELTEAASLAKGRVFRPFCCWVARAMPKRKGPPLRTGHANLREAAERTARYLCCGND